VQLPSSVEILNGHGLCKDSAGNIYFTFQPQSVAQDTKALIRFAPDGTGGQLLGDGNALAQGVPHGLRLVKEGAMEYLYHSNNAATVHKTYLNGTIIWTANEARKRGRVACLTCSANATLVPLPKLPLAASGCLWLPLAGPGYPSLPLTARSAPPLDFTDDRMDVHEILALQADGRVCASNESVSPVRGACTGVCSVQGEAQSFIVSLGPAPPVPPHSTNLAT
jgi:hypothetical protein